MLPRRSSALQDITSGNMPAFSDDHFYDAESLVSSLAALRIQPKATSKKKKKQQQGKTERCPKLAEIEDVLRKEHEESGCSMTVLKETVSKVQVPRPTHPPCKVDMHCKR